MPPTLDELRVEARYHHDRFALYRAKAQTGKLVSPVRLRELERAADRAQERLHAATHAVSPTPPVSPGSSAGSG